MSNQELTFLTKRLETARIYRSETRKRKHNQKVSYAQFGFTCFAFALIMLLWSIGLKEFNIGILVIGVLTLAMLQDMKK